MRPVRPGARGPAVEDIQRRLLALGFDLGRTGVDGVFLGLTAEAVRLFQGANGLSEDGVVGPETWSALVDAGFTLGDRMLYLRLPHFHGHDVVVLQQALNVLGFACGASDGIFGAFTERAVREYQRNAGLPIDGIVGPDTVRTIGNLRHVWEGKESRAHSEARTAPARECEALNRTDIAVTGDDEAGWRIAARLVNLALASTPDSKMHVLGNDETPDAAGVVLHLCASGTGRAVPGRPLVRTDGPEVLAARLITAISVARTGCREIIIELGDPIEDERDEQRAAVTLLDAVCSAFD